MCYYSCDVTEKPADNEYMFKLPPLNAQIDWISVFLKDINIIFSLEKYIDVDDFSTIHKIVN